MDSLFELPKAKTKKLSSTVSRAHKEGGTAFLSTNADDAANASHLIKIEIYDMKKLASVPQAQHWKHATMRIKYYTDEKSEAYKDVNKIMYNISKQISKTENCKKYLFNASTTSSL